ncbi:alcohol dehydrogenase [Vibrio ishigakensis]|uniref:Alcohol dehydrogenase n=1 Tax=Vibrio ishigakensis TaxID=1481914 RepID=A0A0B8Q944_9VIBR|nr:alcohol dehydrogenase [Vibrio ishigakensis]
MLDIKLHDFSKPVELTQSDIPTPKKDSVVVKLEATPLLSYTRDYLQGNLPYAYPPMPFTPGTNAIGVIHEVGEGVVSLKKGQRVVVDCNWEKSEGVANPERVLIGLTGISANSQPMLEEFPNGTWREYGDFPAQVIMPIEGVDDIPSTQLVTLARFIVPFGGLRRMNLRAGETVVINGASGYFGSAAAMGALAMGANVIMLGRNAEKLQKIADSIAPNSKRVSVVGLSDDLEADVAKVRALSSNGVHKALDMIGQSNSAHSTMVALNSLNPNGQLVLMGSMLTPLPVDYNKLLLNNLEIKGNFMYTRDDYLALVDMVKAGLIDLNKVEVTSFGLDEIEQGIESAKSNPMLSNTVLKLG